MDNNSPQNESLIRTFEEEGIRLPLRLRRPTGLEDFRRMETHQRFWSGTANSLYKPFLLDALAVPSANAPKDGSAPFHQPQIGRRKKIAPQAKNWAFFLLEDAEEKIIGLFSCGGLTEAAKDRLLSPDESLLTDDLPWSDRYVIDPAIPETHRYAYVDILANWSKPHHIAPLIESAYRSGEFLRSEMLFAQSHHEPDDGDFVAAKFGFRCVRECPPTEGRSSLMKLWAWERTPLNEMTHQQFKWRLDATPDQVRALARFYQSLGPGEREEIPSLLQGTSVSARAKVTGYHHRTIEVRHERLRAALLDVADEILSERGGETSDGDLRMVFPLYAMDLDSSPSSPIGALLGQSAPAVVLRLLAWFYGDLPHEVDYDW